MTTRATSAQRAEQKRIYEQRAHEGLLLFVRCTFLLVTAVLSAWILSTTNFVQPVTAPEPEPDPIVMTFPSSPESETRKTKEPDADAVPLGEWLKTYDLDLGEKLNDAPVRVRVKALGFGQMGRYIDESIVEIAPSAVADPDLHRGVLMHEISHRYCGWHVGESDAWAACAEKLGVPERFRREVIPGDADPVVWLIPAEAVDDGK